MLSFWEENSLLRYDVIIVGGGIVGLSTAAALLENNSDLKVLILERGLLPSGASTKNAGFACFGSVSELWNDLEQLGEERSLVLVRQRWEGLQLLIKRLGKAAIGYQHHGGYELLREEELKYLDKIEAINQAIFPLFGERVFRGAHEKTALFGFSSEKIKGLIKNPYEAQIDTGEMMSSLWAYVSKLGAKILTGAEVEGWEILSDRVEVVVKNPLRTSSIAFQAERLAVCSNAFSRKFFPEIDLKPGRGQVLITEPLEELAFKGVFHMEEGYYYFRNYKNRIILGGGRNLDIKGEETLKMETTFPIQSVLEQILETVILPGKKAKIARRWAGIMAFGTNKEPICQQVEDRLCVAIRLGGMGIAIGSGLGKELAELLLK